MSELNHVGLWNRCLEIIRDNVPEQGNDLEIWRQEML